MQGKGQMHPSLRGPVYSPPPPAKSCSVHPWAPPSPPPCPPLSQTVSFAASEVFKYFPSVERIHERNGLQKEKGKIKEAFLTFFGQCLETLLLWF